MMASLMMWPTFPKWWLNRGTQSDGNCVGGRKNSSILQSQLAWVSESDCNPPLGRVRLLSLPFSSSAPNHRHHLLRTAFWAEPPLFIDCQVSHSGPLLQYQCNSGPLNIKLNMQYHTFQYNTRHPASDIFEFRRWYPNPKGLHLFFACWPTLHQTTDYIALEIGKQSFQIGSRKKMPISKKGKRNFPSIYFLLYLFSALEVWWIYLRNNQYWTIVSGRI